MRSMIMMIQRIWYVNDLILKLTCDQHFFLKVLYKNKKFQNFTLLKILKVRRHRYTKTILYSGKLYSWLIEWFFAKEFKSFFDLWTSKLESNEVDKLLPKLLQKWWRKVIWRTTFHPFYDMISSTTIVYLSQDNLFVQTKSVIFQLVLQV